MSKKLCKDTEIKAFSHWHFEFSMARFWEVPVFSNKVWTVRLSSTAWSTTWPNLHKSPLDNGEIFLYSRSWLVGQRNRCWIKGWGKNPQNEWARPLFAVPFVRGLPSVTHWTPRNGVSAKVRVRISRIIPQNIYTRFTVGKSFACIHVIRRELVKAIVNNWVIDKYE